MSVFLPLLLFPYFVAAQIRFTTSTTTTSSSEIRITSISGSDVIVAPSPPTPSQTTASGPEVSVTSANPASPSTTTPFYHSSSSDSGPGGSIVGISVAGGVVVIGVIAFFVWRFNKKRLDLDKNSLPLPVRNARRSGFDTTNSRDKTQPVMTHGGGAVLPSSDPGSRPVGTPAVDSSQQQRGLVPQLAADLQEPLPPPRVPRLRPESGQTSGQVQSLRREVEQLRKEMDAILRAGKQQPHMTEEMPPGYIES